MSKDGFKIFRSRLLSVVLEQEVVKQKLRARTKIT